MKLRIKNKGASPTFVHSTSGRLPIEPGQEVTGEFEDGEAANIKANTAVFEVTGYVAPKPGEALKNVERGADGDTPEMAAMRKRFDVAYGELNNAHTVTLADLESASESNSAIRDALGLDDGDDVLESIVSLMAENTDLKAQIAKFDADGDGKTGGSKSTTAPVTLTQAIAALDDANDAHWIQSGKPDLAHLKEVTGGEVTRAEVDALNRIRKTA
jgi:hypothetical protein